MMRNLLSSALVCIAILAMPAQAQDDVPNDLAIESVPATSHVVASGDTLDAILSRAGIAAQVRAEAALALDGVYDLARLRPGHLVEWTVPASAPDRLQRLTLTVSDGVQVALTFSQDTTVQLYEPETQTVERRETLTLSSSLYNALVEQGAPERFAVDLAGIFAGQVDFRRDLRGGETFALVWSEDQLPDGAIAGEPRLTYARLELGTRVIELLATSAAGPMIVFEDGEAIQRSAPPILGARLSSVFGRRNHPVLGGVRMHTGIDYAAPVGTEVSATGAGRVTFVGTMRGYGLTIDLDHGGGVVTRYAHLSQTVRGLVVGARVKAGDPIGAVGATGLVSGPNLHYEVRLDGEPVDPREEIVTASEEVASAEDLLALTTWRQTLGFVTPPDEGNQG